MSDWMLVGIGAVATLVLAGGGGWILNVIKGSKNKPTPS